MGIYDRDWMKDKARADRARYSPKQFRGNRAPVKLPTMPWWGWFLSGWIAHSWLPRLMSLF